jgi:hypothetical protein
MLKYIVDSLYNGYMILSVKICLLSLVFLFLLSPNVLLASSGRAYTDYLYQLDAYRQHLSEFKISKNEYEKFKTLTSQTAALEKTKQMLTTRDTLLLSYLTLLTEKLEENTGLSAEERDLYKASVQKERQFITEHVSRIPAIASIPEATIVSIEFESHYNLFSTSIRQVIIGLSLGQTYLVEDTFDSSVSMLKTFIDEKRAVIDTTKLITIDRWILSVENKRNLYQQTIDDVIQVNTTLKPSSPDELDRQVSDMQDKIVTAKTYLMEGVSNINEIISIIQFR